MHTRAFRKVDVVERQHSPTPQHGKGPAFHRKSSQTASLGWHSLRFGTDTFSVAHHCLGESTAPDLPSGIGHGIKTNRSYPSEPTPRSAGSCGGKGIDPLPFRTGRYSNSSEASLSQTVPSGRFGQQKRGISMHIHHRIQPGTPSAAATTLGTFAEFAQKCSWQRRTHERWWLAMARVVGSGGGGYL